jgi:hypothetical protein
MGGFHCGVLQNRLVDRVTKPLIIQTQKRKCQIKKIPYLDSLKNSNNSSRKKTRKQPFLRASLR